MCGGGVDETKILILQLKCPPQMIVMSSLLRTLEWPESEQETWQSAHSTPLTPAIITIHYTSLPHPAGSNQYRTQIPQVLVTSKLEPHLEWTQGEEIFVGYALTL